LAQKAEALSEEIWAFSHELAPTAKVKASLSTSGSPACTTTIKHKEQPAPESSSPCSLVNTSLSHLPSPYLYFQGVFVLQQHVELLLRTLITTLHIMLKATQMTLIPVNKYTTSAIPLPIGS